jgi:anti-anti-sigma factor
LSRVTFIDSVSLGMLVGCHKTLRAPGGALRIVSGRSTVRRMLAISGLDQVLTVVEPWAIEKPVA